MPPKRPKNWPPTAKLALVSQTQLVTVNSTDGTVPGRVGNNRNTATISQLASWQLFWGDGTQESGVGPPPLSFTHTYQPSVTSALVRLIVTDVNTLKAEATLTVTPTTNQPAPPPPTPPSAPSNFVGVLTPTTNLPQLTWTDVSDETSYQLERRVSGGTFTLYQTLAAESVSYVDAGVVAGTTYDYRLRAVNAGGASAYSATATLSVPATAPPPSTPPTAVLTASPTAVLTGATVTFSTAGTAAGGAPLASWLMNYGDGLTQTGSGAPPASFTHQYANVGNYQPVMTVTDTGGLTATAFSTPIAVSAPSSGTTLTTADFTYLGMMKMPTAQPFANTDFSFSQALMTGRRVSGSPSLFISGPERGSNVGADPADLNEISLPAENTLTTDVTTCPRATLIRSWDTGTVWKGTILPNSGPPDNNYAKITGIHYVERGNGAELFWTYASAYGNPGEFPNLKTSVLNNVGTSTDKGPWGASAGWENTCGWFVPVPASVQAATGCGPYAVGAQVRGNAGGSPWGVNLQTLNMPFSTPPDPNGGQSVTSRTAIYHGSTTPQARNTNYRFCAPNLANQSYPCSGGAVLSASNDGAPASPAGTPGPFPVFGLPQQYYPGIGVTLDWIDCMVWIDGPNKQGVLAFGQLVETISIANGFSYDLTYAGTDPTHAHTGYGGNPCCHNQSDPTFEANGPYAGSLVNYGWIYDPADLTRILNGQLAPAGASPTQTFTMASLTGGGQSQNVGIPVQRLRKYAFGGAWFDATAKRLYLSERGRYTEGFDILPVVHVFDVNC